MYHGLLVWALEFEFDSRFHVQKIIRSDALWLWLPLLSTHLNDSSEFEFQVTLALANIYQYSLPDTLSEMKQADLRHSKPYIYIQVLQQAQILLQQF
jgi:hypothetical protein